MIARLCYCFKLSLMELFMQKYRMTIVKNGVEHQCEAYLSQEQVEELESRHTFLGDPVLEWENLNRRKGRPLS